MNGGKITYGSREKNRKPPNKNNYVNEKYDSFIEFNYLQDQIPNGNKASTLQVCQFSLKTWKHPTVCSWSHSPGNPLMLL